jgi:hypothetical protein
LEATKMSSVCEGISKLWCIQTLEYYSVIKRSEKTWMKLKCILLSERNNLNRLHNYMIPNISFWKSQNYRDSEKTNGSQVSRGDKGWIGGAFLGEDF